MIIMLVFIWNTYIFPPRWPTLQHNIKVNSGENCMDDTSGTRQHRPFTRVHAVCMYKQPFSIFLWGWRHMERHNCSVKGYQPMPQRDAQRDREDVLEMSAATYQERGLPSVGHELLGALKMSLKTSSFTVIWCKQELQLMYFHSQFLYQICLWLIKQIFSLQNTPEGSQT